MARRQKRTIFIYCEGKTDYLFIQYLKIVFSSSSKRIKPKKRNGGGPSSMIRKIANNSAEEYDEKYIFLDLDQDKNKEQCENDAKQKDITLIWSDPCLEGLFLQILNNNSQMPNSKKYKSYFKNKYNSGQDKYDLVKLKELFPKDKLISKKEKISTLSQLIEIINNIGDQKNL